MFTTHNLKNMKKTLLLLALGAFALPQTLLAQDSTKACTTGAPLHLTFSQTALSNWQAGGDNALSGNALFSAFANRSVDLWHWDNSLDIAYGVNIVDGDFTKTDDRLEINSKLGHDLANPNWRATGSFTFRTQFYEGVDEDDVRISDWMAPGYIFLGLGADYVPSENLSVYLSPVTSKMTFVLDQDLANDGAFGVDAAERDTAGNIITEGQQARVEVGAYVKIVYTKTNLIENVDFSNKVDFYANYLENFGNIDINWELLFTAKVNSWLSASLSLTMIYDDDIMIDRRNDAGDVIGAGPAAQFKEVFGAGLTFKLP